jgi:RHS repeat-associated protein
MCDGSGATSSSFDPMGREQQISRTIQSVQDKFVKYTYNLDGSVANSTTSPLKTITYTYNTAGEMTAAKDNGDGITFVNGGAYNPIGRLATMYYSDYTSSGNIDYSPGIQVNEHYNNRLQLSQIYATCQSPSTCPSQPNGYVMNRSYNFNLGNGTSGSDNGNVISITNNLVTARSQNFTYDSLNRIAAGYSTGTNWGETYNIDAWGNLTSIGPYGSNTPLGNLNCGPASTQNRLTTCFGYDAAGNMTSNGSLTYTYDAENRLIAAGGQNYLYDGDGNRVAKCTSTCASGTPGTFYWRGADGNTLVESTTAGVFQYEYVFFNGQRVAQRSLTGSEPVYYYFSDHLGTHVIITDGFGNVNYESDFSPYGEEMNQTDINSFSQHYKFTGKERDTESGLDMFGARYYSSSLGRFMQTDPKLKSLKKMVDPQQWNMYSYSRNNPTSYFDPDGREVQALDAGALNQIRLTLPASVRSSVVADKNGFISGKALSGVKSSDANFQTLQHMVDAKGTVQVSTGPTATDKSGKTVEFKYESSDAVKGDLQSKGITPTAGKDYSTNFSGITYGADESKSGNIEVHVSDATGKASTLPGEEETVTMGHELYVHGDRLLDGRPAEHENSPNGEVNKETHEVEQRTRENAKQKDPQ